ncbi:hypothetical protein AB4Z40_34660 [Bosea sp. 2YAB26]|uniref:hypothetical protein n=1 Tax=Bosea sp. 2YAB26 TaxID=3237478 RepID=UPI003F92DF3D
MKSATALLAITLAVFAVSAARAATHDDATQIVMPRSIVTERTLAGYRNGDPVRFSGQINARLFRLHPLFR